MIANDNRTLCVAGAGNIGCYVGGILAAAGRPVTLLARPRIADEIRAQGLRLSGTGGFSVTVRADQLTLTVDPAALSSADIILVTVKSRDTAAMATAIARHAKPGTVVISLQNGVGNVPVLRAAMTGQRVLGGMVPFNVTAPGEGRFHRATTGAIVIEADADGTGAALSLPALPVVTTTDITGVQWGKLLINLGNALNALSNLTLRDQLSRRPWRLLLADQIIEALAVLKVAGIKPVSTTPLPASATPHILRLPTPLFRLVAAPMVKIDPQARSSMWDDLQRKQLTEIDDLQGTVIALAAAHNLQVPLLRRVSALIKQAEAARAGSPGLTADLVRAGV
jgi:2-dehydropantoate 2-reductase